LAALLMI